MESPGAAGGSSREDVRDGQSRPCLRGGTKSMLIAVPRKTPTQKQECGKKGRESLLDSSSCTLQTLQETRGSKRGLELRVTNSRCSLGITTRPKRRRGLSHGLRHGKAHCALTNIGWGGGTREKIHYIHYLFFFFFFYFLFLLRVRVGIFEVQRGKVM